MRSIVVSLVLAGCASTPTDFTDGGADVAAVVGEERRFSFDDDAPGALPDAFIKVLGNWSVRAVEGGKGLAQDGAFSGPDFPRVVLKSLTFGDLDLKVRCRPEAGSVDQACGVMFHLKDSNNYLITRANALEDNVRLYRVVDGDRQQFASASAVIEPMAWYELAVSVRGDEIVVSWNGQELIRERDSTFGVGKVGLWTKADSVTVYDDLSVTAR